jgi:hypothetical protein
MDWATSELLLPSYRHCQLRSISQIRLGDFAWKHKVNKFKLEVKVFCGEALVIVSSQNGKLQNKRCEQVLRRPD